MTNERISSLLLYAFFLGTSALISWDLYSYRPADAHHDHTPQQVEVRR